MTHNPDSFTIARQLLQWDGPYSRKWNVSKVTLIKMFLQLLLCLQFCSKFELQTSPCLQFLSWRSSMRCPRSDPSNTPIWWKHCTVNVSPEQCKTYIVNHMVEDSGSALKRFPQRWAQDSISVPCLRWRQESVTLPSPFDATCCVAMYSSDNAPSCQNRQHSRGGRTSKQSRRLSFCLLLTCWPAKTEERLESGLMGIMSWAGSGHCV